MAQTEEFDVTEGADRYPDVVYRYRPGTITSCRREDRNVTFVTDNDVVLVASVITPEIIHLNYALDGDFVHDFSYAVDPEFEPGEAEFEFRETTDYYEISTSALICRITKEKLLVHFYDSDEQVLCRDKHGFYRRDSLMKGISEVKVTKEAPKSVQFYGLGDKPVELNLRGRAYENWNTDSYDKRGQDPLYRSIPFYMALFESRAYGIFFDNTYQTRFSFDRKKNNISSFSAAGGQMNYYFIYGPELQTVSERYTQLTGTPELPPAWALGYHQCRWSYYPEERVREIAQTFRELEIPCDAIYLDIDYMDNYKVFTWNRDYFPDPAALIGDLKKEGFQTIVMVDPGIRVDHDYPVYEEGKEKGYFCTRPDGELMIGPVWPPRCVFPDYTDPEVREWWADLYDEFMNGIKVSGIWNDMNEPAVFEVINKTFPDDIRHDFDGHPCSHKKAHNIYGMQMARASLEGIKKHAPEKRPFLLTRANFSGGQRYAALWTGDNIASWDHLKLANEQCQRLSISGFSFCGSDIGGFVETPSPELYIRWLQLGIFHPLFRTHSMGYNVDGAAAVKKEQVEDKKELESDLDQEPWSFGKQTTERSRKAIEFRYRLLDYLYTAFWKYVNEYTPVIKPLVFYDQNDEKASRHADEFMFGDHLLVSPVMEKGKKQNEIYLPEGSWYHYWDDKKYVGRETYSIKTSMDYIPLFVKAGTVLPLREVMQYHKERKQEVLELLVYHGEETTTSLLYEDDEEGYDYLEEEYRLTEFAYQYDAESGETILSASREGAFEPEYGRFDITFIGLPGDISACLVDGDERSFNSVERNGNQVARVSVKPDFEQIVLR